MPEGENKDDLFEDLDKFFAPIQDVDWPETKLPPDARPQHADQDPPSDSGDEIHLPEADGPADSGEVFAVSDDEGTWTDEPDPSSLLDPGGTAADEDDAPVQNFGQPASGYVDLPTAREAEAELDEPELDEPELEEPPSAEAVEAAVDHFAESVREEVTDDPGRARVPSVTEPVTSAADDDLVPEDRSSVRTVRVGPGPEGLGGPSWQEPTTMEVGSPDERRSGGRDVPAAFLTGLVLAALAIGSLAIDPAAFAIVAGAIVVWAQGELYRALQRQHHQPATALGLASGALVMSAAYFRGEAAMLSVFALSIVATFMWFMTTPGSHRKGTTVNVGLTILGVAYIPLLGGYALVLLEQVDGPALVLSVIGLTFVYDTAAFVVGSWWGSRPLAPAISPKKSVEGAIGATLVVIAAAVGAVAPFAETLNTLSRSVGLAVVVAVFAPLGDLAESLIKRDLGVKDMGSVLPGHGGVLDRIDSLLFVAPAAFLFLRLILT